MAAWRRTSKTIVLMQNPESVVYLVEHYANWSLPLYVMGALFLVGAAAWGLIDPRRPVFR